jgi:hypothetical protein
MLSSILIKGNHVKNYIAEKVWWQTKILPREILEQYKFFKNPPFLSATQKDTGISWHQLCRRLLMFLSVVSSNFFVRIRICIFKSSGPWTIWIFQQEVFFIYSIYCKGPFNILYYLKVNIHVPVFQLKQVQKSVNALTHFWTARKGHARKFSSELIHISLLKIPKVSNILRDSS